MRSRLYPALFGIAALSGCQGSATTSNGSASNRPQDLIVGCWESDSTGVEFTASGSVTQLGQTKSAQYTFADDETIELKSGPETMRLKVVQLTRDGLTVTPDRPGGRPEKFRRVKEFSAKLIAHVKDGQREATASIRSDVKKSEEGRYEPPDKDVTSELPEATKKQLPDLTRPKELPLKIAEPDKVPNLEPVAIPQKPVKKDK